MKKVKTSISLDEDVYEFILKIAESERLNLSLVINSHFAKLLEKEKT
jgi:hypothetical protein